MMEWISVGDRLPEDGVIVLIGWDWLNMFSAGFRKVGAWWYTDQFDAWGNRMYAHDVTHWCYIKPLEPPQR